MDNKKPSSVLTQSGRRKSGGATQLRSPVVKRPAMAPVALQGWLHKQGSEGLMLWKKRWFVLSEYCLFYYKGPEEEKLLGSILLPSYKVSPCTADDKIYRKFAFKAEHANMRTYYFAAESRELMTQWMNALSLATILQEGTKLQKPLNTSSMNSLANQSADDSDSGFQAYRSRSGPVTVQPNKDVNGWVPQNPRFQPLYANAPPKPKRLNNEGQYGGSSPEGGRSDDAVIYGNRQQIDGRGSGVDYHYHAGQRGYHPGSLPHPDIIRTMPMATGTYPVDRRSQEIHSNATTPSTRLPAKGTHPEDYSDVYKGDSYNPSGMYQRPDGPAHLNYVKSVNPPFANYQHANQYYQGYHQLPTMSSESRYPAEPAPRRDARQPPRPHSADFLDFDAKKSYQSYRSQPSAVPQASSDPRPSQPYQSTRPQRPKSSLDIMHASDGYYWSEESYAEKMRQSAMYLQNTLPQRSQSSRSNTPNLRQQMGDGRVPIGPGSGKSDQSVLRYPRRDADGSKSPMRGNRWSEYDGTTAVGSGAQFVRSASARLAKNRMQDDESDEVQAYTGGEDFKDDGRKEESMKRLLEWKQRMLQSPLTRKPSGSSTRGTAQNELSKFYKHQVMKELERQEAKSREEIGKKRLKPDGVRLRSRSTDGRRSAMSSSRYNSYSSDDEDAGDARKERTRRQSMSSGRSRKSTDDSSKTRKPPTDSRYISPDYENVTQSDDVPYLKKDTDNSDDKSNEFEVKNQPSVVVYPSGSDPKTKWDDETKLIKEFSYQYVKDTPPKTVDVQSYKVLESPPENIVKSRIKQLGLEGKETEPSSSGKDVNMKEPLKVTAPLFLPNEAHVSTLKNRNSKSLRQFALGEAPQAATETEAKESPNQKSVKDLLADFERKSQLVHEKENEKSFEESPGKRYVFSDTETLLYDTSSDTEDKAPKTDSSILANRKSRPESRIGASVDLTEEEDGDEEVAAALGRRERFFSSCRDLGRKRDPELPKKQLKHMGTDDVEPSPSSEVETLMVPGYVRSNLTESVALREQSDSTCSTPVIEKIKDNLERTLPKENLVKTPDSASKEDAEGHYMPMTPSRRVSAPPSDKSRSNSSLHSILYGVEVEETYVEMETSTDKPTKRYSDLNSYCEIPGGKQESHYDFLYKSTSMREPEYMEVNTLLEILKEQDEKIKEHKGAMESASAAEQKARSEVGPPTPARAALPDILNSSATSQQKSDSSDADDESSKDLDSLDTPRHPRFSLSDTFRPASYYLGNDNGRNLIGVPNPSENHDSSDSDLVSPPPIPTSPPPLDDLDTSVETVDSRPKLKISDKDSSKRLWSKPNRNELDTAEDYKKIKRRPVSEDILETLNETDYYEKKLPVSELDSIGSRNGLVLDEENGNINLDEYLDGLQLNPQLYTKNLNESIYKSYEKELHKNLMPKESVNKTDTTEKGLLKLKYDDRPTEDPAPSSSSFRRPDEVQYENLQNLFPPPPPELYESGSDFSLGMYRNMPLADVPPPENYCDVYEPTEPAATATSTAATTSTTKIRFDPDTLQQQPDPVCKENQGAPYYYSDIIKRDEEDFGSSTSDRSLSSLRGHLGLARYQPLNNQRDDVQEPGQSSKRNNIGRKVNPISQSIACAPQTESDDLDDMQKITQELRTTSAYFMGTADKSGSFDVRNIYESDTLQRRKVAAPVETLRVRTPDLHHPLGVARNLYPHGLKDKTTITNPSNILVADSPSRERSRSLEGLLSEAEASTPAPAQTPQAARTDGHLRVNSCEGDDLWEKDALWRENLRKVSLRHTRSLDNLDDDSGVSLGGARSGRRSVDHFTTPQRPPPPTTGRRSVDHFTPRTKLSRDVTYVNDGYRRGGSRTAEYEQDYREGRVRPRKRDPEIRTVVELSDSGVLDCDDGVHYERLTRGGRKRGDGEVPYLDGYEWDEEGERFRKGKPQSSTTPAAEEEVRDRSSSSMEAIDREKLRQWDLMSSGIVEQQEKQQGGGEVTKVRVSTPAGIGASQEPTKSKQPDEDQQPSQLHHQSPRQQESALTSDASASGSVMRESHLPHSMSGLASTDGQQQQQQHSPRVAMTPTSLVKQASDDPAKKLRSPTPTERSLADELTDHRIDYYDRGKVGYHPQVNGYPSDWSDPYGEGRKSDGSGGVRDYIDDRRRQESEFYQEPYGDQRLMYSRHCGTLPMAKGPGTTATTLSLQGSSMGRSMGTLDSRTSGKDVTGKRKMSAGGWGLDVSAGELLGRTHEELVLLLIQLRRQSAGVCKAMETCHIEIEAQARLADMETPKRMEHLQKLEELKKHLLDLEKQYEKGKPLVNLVDNMVKLGSLYRGSNSHVYNGSASLDPSFNVREKLEFNQKVQEQRLLAEERRDWDRLSPDHGQLQAKVQQLYRLDRLLQEESGTLHSLQQDKELLEKALGGLRHKLQNNRSNPIEADRYRKQQKLLEKELSRVRLLLAHNSKKLEETVAENARLEQELVILRQKLQASRVSSRNSVPLLPESATISTTAALEAELRRVQQLVGDLQRQRHELSAQVKQLTEKSDTLVQQIRPGPTGVAGAGPIPGKKKSSATWLETDLDLLVTQDVGVESPVTSPQQQQVSQLSVTPTTIHATTGGLSPRSTTPIYINTEPKRDPMTGEDAKSPNRESERTTMTYCTPVELSEADDRMKRFYGIIPREKQEIKTVRIVKRESERRQRDRDRSGNIGIPVGGGTAIAKRVSVIDEAGSDAYGLGKVVEEDSSETYQGSPAPSEQSEDYGKVNGDDPYLNFHPTNPFLPQNMAHLEEVDESRSMSLPRGFGKSPSACENLRNAMAKRNRVRFQESGDGVPSGPRTDSPSSSRSGYLTPQLAHPQHIHQSRMTPRMYGQRALSPSRGYYPPPGKLDPDYLHVQVQKQTSPESSGRPLTAREQLFGPGYYDEESISPQLSPVYQSEAAREIIMEMSSNPARNNRRQVPREKRRHHTVSNIRHVCDTDSNFSKMGSARSRDDLDMERALRPRMNAPDVVRSTMSHKDLKYNESTIDSILGTPNKIVIPERYIPEQEPVLTAEEQMQRLRKAESIRKMLSETTALSTPDLSAEGAEEDKKSSTLKKKVEEEKKQREHLLELNQILAQQVMEKSKLVAVKALASLPLERKESSSFDEDDLSPVQPLPLYQQRENFFS